MNEGASMDAVSNQDRVRLRYGVGGGVRSEGRALAYSIHPQILIETDDGERIWWRADMAEVAVAAPPEEEG